MLRRVYIETTVPSFYYTLRTDSGSLARMTWTRQWWHEYAEQFELTSSAAVIAELRRGASEKTESRIKLLKDVQLLPITDEVEQIASIYVDKLVMPREPAGDALHLAIASFHRTDVLLTWNCRHLANPNKMEHIRLVNYELGLPMPLLTTPLNFLSGDEPDD